jgi:hypothetical protein
MITTIYVLLALTVWMGEELDVHTVNVFPTQADCMKALAAETLHTNSLPHCCGGAEILRCFAWSGQSLKPHIGAYFPKPRRPLDQQTEEVPPEPPESRVRAPGFGVSA